MTQTQMHRPPRLTRLTFHGPLGEARAARIVERLVRANPGTVLDIGCGWAELMLRILEAAPGATGTGIDLDRPDLARGRASARARGLDGRVELIEESAIGTARGPADLVLCLGASQALSDAPPPGHLAPALTALRGLVKPGGRVLFGDGFWERPPTDAQLAAMWPDASADELPDLAGFVDVAVDAGFRPEWIEVASQEEWDDFESGYQADVEEWLATHDAPDVRAEAAAHRAHWLRGYRNVLGLAYLTLIPADTRAAIPVDTHTA